MALRAPRQYFGFHALQDGFQRAKPHHDSSPQRPTMAASPSPYVTLISSDGFEFIVSRDAACVAGTIKKMLDPQSAWHTDSPRLVHIAPFHSIPCPCPCPSLISVLYCNACNTYIHTDKVCTHRFIRRIHLRPVYAGDDKVNLSFFFPPFFPPFAATLLCNGPYKFSSSFKGSSSLFGW